MAELKKQHAHVFLLGLKILSSTESKCLIKSGHDERKVEACAHLLLKTPFPKGGWFSKKSR